MNEFLYSLDFDVLCHLIHSFMPRYAVPVRQYRPLQSRLLQCTPHGKPPCDLLMLPDVIGRIRDSPPESFLSGRSPSGSFFFKRTIFAIQGTHIKIKRNLKKKGIVGYQTVVLLMKCVQVQKMRTTLWHKFFFYLFAFFAGTVSLRIPSFLNFVNPFFVTGKRITTPQPLTMTTEKRRFCDLTTKRTVL